MKENKESCFNCKGHGGTYDINPTNGDIIGVPCDFCNENYFDEQTSEYVLIERAKLVKPEKDNYELQRSKRKS